MDLTVETKRYAFIVPCCFDYITIWLCSELKQNPKQGSYHYLTKKEMRNLIEYLKQDNYGDGRDSWIIDRLTNTEMLMEGKETAAIHFW